MVYKSDILLTRGYSIRPISFFTQSYVEDQSIQFDGTPYFVLGQKIFDCRNGKDRKEAWKQKRKELVEKVRFCIS